MTQMKPQVHLLLIHHKYVLIFVCISSGIGDEQLAHEMQKWFSERFPVSTGGADYLGLEIDGPREGVVTGTVDSRVLQ